MELGPPIIHNHSRRWWMFLDELVFINIYIMRDVLTGLWWHRRAFRASNFTGGQPASDLRAVFPFSVRRDRHWSCRHQSGCLEGSLDCLLAQNICSYCNGNSTAQNDPKSPTLVLHSLLVRICHLQSSWRRHWHHNRRHNSRRCGKLDLRHLHGPCLWSFHIRFH